MATNVYVGSARSDENGKAYGGKAGDQKSGREVSTQLHYVHSKGWRVFRAKDPAKAAIIGDSMRAACDNNMIGYDQWERYDLFAEAKKVGFDLAKVAVATECDCSELVRCCCAAAGIMDLPTSGFRTGNMPKYLLATGEFVELKGTKYTEQAAYLGKGDILVTAVSGHTVVVLNNGDKYEGTIEEKVYALGERTLRNGDEGDDVKTLQNCLLKLNISVGDYGADGDFGDDTEKAVKAFQEKYKLKVDGVYGEKSHEAMLTALETPEIIVGSDPSANLLVAAGSWNVRTGPGTEYSIVTTVHGGDKLAELEVDGWIPIKLDGKQLWISKNALEG